MYNILLLFLITFLGFSFGSFMNVIILRTHSKKAGILTGRSECPKCKTNLTALDLIPVFSYLFLRGKCRYCKATISPQYIGIELFTGLLWLFLALNVLSVAINQQTFIIFIFFLVVFNLLILIGVYDIKYLEVPYKFTFPFIIPLLIASILPFTPSFLDSIFGAFLIFGFFYLQVIIPFFYYAIKNKNYKILIPVFTFPFWFLIQIFSIHKWFNKNPEGENDLNLPKDLVQWIGFGDFRIAAIIGILLGFNLSIVALFISYIIGAIVGIFILSKSKNKITNTVIPFGPFLVVGTIITLFYGVYFINFYLQFGSIIRSLIEFG